jgi:phytoene dehydrogenase-like protein
MQTTAEHCVAPNGALALDIYRYGCQYKIGGLETIAQDLADYLKAHGGNVFHSTLAKTISTTNKRVQGVVTNRAQFEAPVVISAVPLANTAALLPEDVTSNLPQRAATQPEMWGAFTLYLGVDERVLPKDVHVYEQVTDLEPHLAAGNCLVSISPAWDRSRSPKGKRAITVSTHVDAATWLAHARNKEVYRQEKQRFETILLDQVEKALPNVRAGVEVMMSGSPRTFYNFTRRDGGRVGGIPQTLAAANFAAPSHRSDVRGLYLAGDTVFPGQGTLGVSVSGYNAARSAARFLRRAPPNKVKYTNLQQANTQTSTQKSPHDEHPQEVIT